MATGLLAALCLAPAVVDAHVASAGAPSAPPGCSTAVAPGPALPTVGTTFVSQAEEPFGVAVSVNGRTAFVADASGAVVVYSLGSGSPKLDDLDAFRPDRQDQPAPPPLGGVSPLGVVFDPGRA